MRWEASACLLALLASGPARLARADEPAAPLRRASVAKMADPDEVRRRLGLVPEYEDVRGVESVKIAVLDYGFAGIEGGRGYLPAGARVVEHYDPDFVRRNGLGDPEYRKPFEPLNAHGRVMAQIVWAVTGSRPGGPSFYLLNANGPTMLRRAVRYAIEQKVDIILFSGSFEGGGNGDGRGPVDRIVADAAAAGILWINAAGNYGQRVYNGPLRILPDGYLRLRNGSDVAALRFRNRVDENTVTVTLTWNEYRDDEDAGADRDLDLYVEDWAGRRVGSGVKTQIPGGRAPGPQESLNPRERVVLADLPASPVRPDDPDYCYRIRIRAKPGHFRSTDRIRVLVTAARDQYLAPGARAPSDALEFLDATGAGEIYPPADHPQVLTVGDTGAASAVGPTADGRPKPEVVLDDSRAFFSDGQVSAGSSNAAAYIAGVVAVLKAAEPPLRLSDLRRLALRGSLVAREPAAWRPLARAIPPPARAERRIAIAPDGRTTILEYAEAPIPRSAAQPGSSLHLWRTPSRARLAEVVRGDR